MALPIAIVEDQTPDAQRLEELLQQQLPEAECTWFTCGDDFLRAAAEPGLYAVVFLDICMAGTNGIETARRLRQADPEVLIVFVTSLPGSSPAMPGWTGKTSCWPWNPAGTWSYRPIWTTPAVCGTTSDSICM